MEFFEDITQIAAQALNKIEKEKMEQQPKTIYEDIFNRVDFGKKVFEEYNHDAAINKMKADILFLDKIMENIEHQLEESENVEVVQEGLSKLIQKIEEQVNAIYEFVNIAPASYKIKAEELNESSIMELENKVDEIIQEYLSNKFYGLTSQQREKLYLESASERAVEMKKKHNLTLEEASQAAIRALILEELIRTIHFPNRVWNRINGLLESNEYSEAFDSQHLQEQVNEYLHQVRRLAEIIALS